MKLTKEQLSTIKEIMNSHLHNLVEPWIPKMLQKVSEVRVKDTKKVFTIETLSYNDINNYYGCKFPNDPNEKILTFTYADNELDLQFMYNVDTKTCIVIQLSLLDKRLVYINTD